MYTQEKIRGQEGSSRSSPWDMSIALRLFIEGLSNGSLFSETSASRPIDESEYQNEGKWYFYIENSQLELRADVSGNIFPFPSKTKNNFRGIDISQPTPLMSPLCPLISSWYTLTLLVLRHSVENHSIAKFSRQILYSMLWSFCNQIA